MTNSLLLSSLATATSNPDPSPWGWMPENASTVAGQIDRLFYFIYYLDVFFFALIIAATVYFMVKYRRRSKGQRTNPIAHSTKLEIIWATIPAILLVVIFTWGFKDWMGLNVPPGEAVNVRVTGQKWSWSYEVEGCPPIGELIVPLGKPVKLTMSSTDVLHSFFVPSFRVKMDLVPNRYTVAWFEATKLGTFDVFCTEYCGNGHSRMLSKVIVVEPEEFKQKLNECFVPGNVKGPDLGKLMFKMRGCNTCHSVTSDDKGLPGPPFGGKYGTMETLVDGSQVKIDDNYIRESIMKPNAQVVKGYAPVMPTFAGQLTEKQVNGLIDYIKSLK